jgi:hypothetical protein
MKTLNDDTQSLQQIPGVGPAIARMLQTIGIESPQDLCGQDPEDLYRRYEEHVCHHVDRCVLYVFRCAVYYCESRNPDPELLKWWNWKDNS